MESSKDCSTMVNRQESAETCDMRGLLSFMVLWLLSTRPMYGQELATEIGKRRGEKPNPGTIYPALKDLTSRGLIRGKLKGRNTVYELTPAGKTSLSRALEYFEHAFGEIFHSVATVRRRLRKGN
ncbi:MAG: PadR family transcriptional regulator [Nitrososphaerales archaeon]